MMDSKCNTTVRRTVLWYEWWLQIIQGLVMSGAATSIALADTSILTPLAPFGADSPGGYDTVVFETLIGHNYTDGWMLVKPSFRPEYAVLINRKLDNVKAGTTVDVIPFQAEVVTVKDMIWNFIQVSPTKWSLAIRKEVPVERTRVNLSNADAESFLDAWFSGLRCVRYQDDSSQGNDGVTIDFHSKERYGSTWSPNDGVALLMMNSGHCLKRYVTSTELLRPGIMDECRKLNSILSKYSKEGGSICKAGNQS